MEDTANQLAAFKSAWKKSLSIKIRSCLTSIQCYGKLEIVELCPTFLFEQVSLRWQKYTPKKRKNNYNLYCKTTSSKIFFDGFAGIWFCRKVQNTFLMATVTEEKPAFLLFSEKLQRLVLVFSYAPTNQTQGWIPRIRFGNKGALRKIQKHQLYLQDK